MNNPVNAIDPDGKDGVKVIDNENKTITIKANYYVVTTAQNYRQNGSIETLAGYTDKDIQVMNKYNDFLNDLHLEVPSGEYKGYNVVFDLQFKDGGSPLDTGLAKDNDLYEGYSIGNSIQRGNEYTHKKMHFEQIINPDGQTRRVGGVTYNNEVIIMNTAEDSKMNRIHEIFHTLGFNHPKGSGGNQGIMKYPSRKPTIVDALELSETSFLPKIQIR